MPFRFFKGMRTHNILNFQRIIDIYFLKIQMILNISFHVFQSFDNLPGASVNVSERTVPGDTLFIFLNSPEILVPGAGLDIIECNSREELT